jgi:hypothetical protein
MRKYLFFCFILLLVPIIGFTKKKEEIKLTNIPGEAVGTENESLKQVRARAVNAAKVNALKEAGIQENINTYTDYFQSETKEEYEELFASSIFTNIQGAVTDVERVKTNKSFTSDNLLQVKVLINCTVIKYNTENDLSFDFEVKGVKPNYNHNDLLTFQFKPYSDGFLKVFIFTKNESYQLYPNNYENSISFLEEKKYKFPLEEINYRLETTKRSQMHRVVFVFLKKDIPYTHEVDYKKIFDWMFRIPPDIRKVKTFSFTVFNESVN